MSDKSKFITWALHIEVWWVMMVSTLSLYRPHVENLSSAALFVYNCPGIPPPRTHLQNPSLQYYKFMYITVKVSTIIITVLGEYIILLWAICKKKTFSRVNTLFNTSGTLPETNIPPLKIGHPKRKLVFQPSILGAKMLVSGRVILIRRLAPFQKPQELFSYRIPTAGKPKLVPNFLYLKDPPSYYPLRVDGWDFVEKLGVLPPKSGGGWS